MRVPGRVLPALFSLLIVAPAHAASLPDSGTTLCDNGVNVMEACSNTNSGDGATMPRQDGRFGRDPAAGGSGFDYSKVCNSGELAGSGSCPADPALGRAADEWGCTQDNLTGLMWEVKVDDATHLRHKDWRYSWYDSNSATNGGNAGTADGGNNCLDTARCDTEKFAADVNAATLCGHGDWRLPQKRELMSLVHHGRNRPAILTDYFPNTVSSNHWMATTYVPDGSFAVNANFLFGTDVGAAKWNSYLARLVRGEPF